MIDEQSTGQDTAELAKILKEGRAAKGWTLRQAAGETGISNGYLSLIEQGDVKAPSPKYLSVLADKYGIAFERLMALAGHPSGPSPVPKAAGTGAGTAGVPRAASVARVAREPSPVAEPWARSPVYGADAADGIVGQIVGPSVRQSPGRLADAAELPGDGLAESPDADERRQLTALVMDDMRVLSTADIAQVRAFISGLRAARRS